MVNLRLVKIGLYARVSSEKQAQEKTINSQIENVISYANALGEKIDPDLRFIDDGISGSYVVLPTVITIKNRLRLKMLLISYFLKRPQ